jgi:hypothetical protein
MFMIQFCEVSEFPGKYVRETAQLMTPAMAAGVTNLPWSKSDILDMIRLVNRNYQLPYH